MSSQSNHSSTKQARLKATNKYVAVIMIVATLWGTLTSCAKPAVSEAEAAPKDEAPYTGKRIVWVDSYHEGYEWSDAIGAGIKSVLDGTGAEIKIVRLDTKRNSDSEQIASATEAALQEIESFDPDVVIASDDNAQKHLVVPHFKDTDLPVVFCAVNWDASGYGYPTSNVTGMIEIELIEQLVEHLKLYAKGDRIAYIGPDITTEQKVARIYNERFFGGQMETRFVKTFEEFKETFLELQEKVDMVYIGKDQGIDGWDAAEAEAFLTANTKVPTGARSWWLSPYVLITLAKVGEEQGEWAAQAALRILDGTPVSDIEVVKNKQHRMILNLNLAEELEVVFTPSMLRNAEVYPEAK